ncbi:MAG: peptide chain release factor 1 [Polaromonas sp.]|nr:peptide chain release factor 1 [Polaromonas sp.]
MKPFLRQTLDRQLLRLHELDALLSASDVVSDMDRFRSLTREHSEIGVVAEQYRKLTSREADFVGAEQLAMESKSEPDLQQMAEEEVAAAKADIAQIDEALQLMLIPKDPDDARAAFIEIRAGTGGDESALFAGDLCRMYTRFAVRLRWTTEIVSESPSELGGYKEIVLRMDGPTDAQGVGVYGKLRFESGGHRVQRVPATETQGRIHTSACTVAVLPEPDEAEAIKINPSDLRIDTYRASGAGGQHINKTDSAVRITHLPTGIVAECQEGRSQHGNKAQALKALTARIHEKDRSERAAKDAAMRKGLIGTGDRSDRIRTYNFPQGRLTDHRINLTLYKLGLIVEGDLGDVITALQVARGAEQLAELETASGGSGS